MSSDTRTDVDALAAVPLFSGLPRARLQSLTSGSAASAVDAGAVVVLRGEPADRLIVVESGALIATYDTASGQRVVLGRYDAPCAVDKAALLDGAGHTTTWVAAVDSRIRRIPRATMMALLDEEPRIRDHVLAHLAGQVRRHQHERVRAGADDATTRAAAWLVHAAADRPHVVVLPDGQQGLGDEIGASRVTTNRALQRLVRDGLIAVRPGAVEILELDALRRRAAASA